MSQLNVDTIKNRAGTGGPTLPSLTVTNNVNVAGLVTAPTFIGNLNGNATGLSGTPNITVQDAVVQGNLTVNGTQTVLNTTELYIEDKTIGIGTTSAATDVSADGAGIIIFGDTEKSFTYNNSKKGFETNIPFVTNETRLITGSEKVTRTSGNVVSLVYNNNSGSNIGFTTNPSGNITLNKQASTYFEHAYNVMLGVDDKSHKIAIKPLTKAEAMSQAIPDNKKYKITIRSSYARITNKAFMEEIMTLSGLNLIDESMKYPATWDNKEQILIVDLKGGHIK
jgi:hypothetical protein